MKIEIGRTTVADILAEEGIEPAPEREKKRTWKQFLKMHWDTLYTHSKALQVAQMPRAGNNIRVSKLSHRPEQDVALLYAPTDDEKGARYMRVRKGELQMGEARPLAQGQSLCGQELVRMRRRAELPMLFDVEVIHPAERPMRDTLGPAQVASDEYRRHWEDTFAPHKASSQLAN